MRGENRFYLPNLFLSVFNRFFFKNPPFSPSHSNQKLKILVYQVGNIGDLIVSTPVYMALRKKYDDAEITLLSSSGSRKYVGAEEIIKPLNLIDNFHTFFPDDFVSLKHYYTFYRTIRNAKYDLIVYLPSNLWKVFTICRDMIFFFLAGIKCGVGFRVYEDYHFYLKHEILPKNEIDRLFDLLKPLEIENGNKLPQFAISNENTKFVQNLLAKHKITGNLVKIGILPGGKYPARLWPGHYFAKLINKINENFSVKIIFLGSESEKELVEKIKKQIKKKPLDTSGCLTIHQTAALIKQCHLLITNDSGPMHIAAAVRTPTVSIFSAVDIPFLWYPTGNNHKIFYNKVECSPCFQKECDNHICMEGISVENVYKAVKEQLYNMDLKKER
tara:strand:- start:6813 stop:7973 length:1161 start_codon:yes stop_codon:yes gene_type:complete